MERSQSQPQPQRKRRRGTFLRMWIQRVSCTSQLDRKSMQHLPPRQHGRIPDGRIAQGEERSRSKCARWGRAGVLLLVAVGASLAADLAEPHHVTAVRFWSLGNVTRIAI